MCRDNRGATQFRIYCWGVEGVHGFGGELLKFLVTATIQRVVEADDAKEAGTRVQYGLESWLVQNEISEAWGEQLDQVRIEGISNLDLE